MILGKGGSYIMSIVELNTGELKEALQKGDVTAEEIALGYLAVLEKEAGAEAAFVTVTAETALERAKELDRERKTGRGELPLEGIPFSLQDNYCTANILTTAGSKILANFKPPYSATAYERLQTGGGVLLGKNKMPEFGLELISPPEGKHPRENMVLGAAAAVAKKQVVFALASDAAGALRRSAVEQGLIGLTPSYGRVSRYGLITFAASLGQVGCISRTVADSAQVLGVIAGLDKRDAATSPVAVPKYRDYPGRGVKGLKVGLPREYLTANSTAADKTSLEKVAAMLEASGAMVEEVSLPHGKYAPIVYHLISAGEASSDLSTYDGVRFGLRVAGEDLQDMYRKTRTAGFGSGVRSKLILGTLLTSPEFYEAYYLQAQKVRTLLRQDFQKVWEDYDLLVTPVMGAGTGVEAGIYQDVFYTAAVNLAGLPALALPLRGKPAAGVQLVSRPFREDILFQGAAVIESA
jgi:aspartyl-tRNA(Asn)/glutamyl-tRNA(Gln) amidotransferase subunit A